MKELLSPANYIWLFSLVGFTILIIVITCYFLRREIISFFQNMFFPDTQRYSMPAGIISNVNTDKVQGPLTPERIAELIEQEENPEAKKAAEERAAQEREAAKMEAQKKAEKKPKEKKGLLRKIETNIRLIFKKVKNTLKNWFAIFAGTEDAPSNAAKKKEQVKIMQEGAPTENLLTQTKETPKKEEENPLEGFSLFEAKEKTLDEEELPQHPAQAEEAETLLENAISLTETNLPQKAQQEQKEENIMENTEEKPIEEKQEEPKNFEPQKTENTEENSVEKTPFNAVALATTAGAAALAAKERNEKENKSTNHNENTENKSFFGDRYILIAAMLIMAGFLIFLTAKVRLLCSLVMIQRTEIRNMQTQMEIMRYEQNGTKIIIHERAISPEKRYNK